MGTCNLQCMCIVAALFLAACDDSGSHIVKFMHANINCSDLTRSQSFYEMLGFIKVMAGESEVTAEFAAALNMPPYKLRFAQMLSKDGSLIDLIEWEDPFDSGAPYAFVNHLGIARLTLRTSDLAGDISTLRAHGVAFFSEPVTEKSLFGSKRFVCFTDPDGTILELAETAGSDATADPGSNMIGIMNVSINCSDYDRSRLFYENLGCKVETESAYDGDSQIAEALGIAAYDVRGALMKLPRGGPSLTLQEWKDPQDSSPPYERLNHLGIPRIALRSTDLDADVARLKATGVEFFSEPAIPEGPLSFLRFVCLRDPDGTIIELVELFPRRKL